MLNYIWLFMLLISFVVSIFTKRVDILSNAIITGAKDAAELCFSLLGTMCLWTGISKIAEKSGLTALFSRLFYPIIHLLFPRLKKGCRATEAMVMNIVANLLGMGNAATPLGIKAMKELDKINTDKASASDEMCMFAVINTASLQLIPATLISLRQSYNSQNPGEIIVPVWISSVVIFIVAVGLCRLFSKKSRKKYIGK